MHGSAAGAAPRVDVLGIPIDPVTVDTLHEALLRFVREDARATVMHANVHAINLAHRHPWFGDILQNADLVFCDGAGVILGARLLGQHLPERITYADWMWTLAALCARERLSLFLLGGKPGVADAAARRLRERTPDLRIAGVHHGYFNKAPGAPESQAVATAINRARPQILVVGMGMPIQERWVAENRSRLDVPVIFTAGAALDYASGELRRAPRWMTSHGLEWLGRLVIEPRRLAGRYLLGNPLFLARVIWARLRR